MPPGPAMSIIEQAAKRLEQLNRAGMSASSPSGDRTVAPASPAEPPALHPAPPAPPAVAGAAEHAPVAAPPTVHDPARSGEGVVLDLDVLERTGQLVPTAERSLLAEELRAIKRPLLKNARSKNAVAERLPLIMVTSALPGEGKTFFAINLAMSIATEIDLSVLLIDADVLRQDA